MSSQKIWAVVVTYNRKDLLAECLDALRAQTRACDRILVVDNASSDDTDAWLAERVDGVVQAVRLSRNTGGAGGFNAGMRIAYQGGADLVWVMDDDVIPAPDALEKLLQAGRALRRRNVTPAYLVSNVFTPDGLATNVPDVDHRQNDIQYANWAQCLDLGVVAIRRATFVSILFSRETLETYGLPLAPMFIWADDSEYTVRVTDQRPGFIVGASRVVHIRALAGALNLATEDNPIRIRFHRYLIRNTAYLVRTHYGRRALVDYVGQQLRHARDLALGGRFAKVRVVLGGLKDAIGFKPQVERPQDPPSALDATVSQILATPRLKPSPGSGEGDPQVLACSSA